MTRQSSPPPPRTTRSSHAPSPRLSQAAAGRRRGNRGPASDENCRRDTESRSPFSRRDRALLSPRPSRARKTGEARAGKEKLTYQRLDAPGHVGANIATNRLVAGFESSPGGYPEAGRDGGAKMGLAGGTSRR
jgi:hypothetical protein